ncbi:MAG: hypothetical protein ABSD50_16170 [Smithella sp.]
MQKPSKTWLECIKVKTYILLLLITCPSLAGAQSDIDQSRSAAQSAAGSAYQYLGSGSAINQNAGQPIMSNTPMTTLDGSQSGNVQMSCPSTTKFVDILIQPGATGDLTTVMVSQDTKLNGQINYQFNMPFPVSGICGNGVIQCNPGTWNNCIFWAWTANTQGQLSIQQTDYTQMGGCYCINNSCGNNIAWTNLPLVLKDLGGGATGAIMSTNPQYSITSTSISDTEIAYYSQALTNCGSGNQGATNPANYFAGGQTDTLVTNAAQKEVATEQTDPNSLYSVMSNAIQYHADLVQEIQCKIIRGISVAESATCPYGNAALNSTKTTCTDQGDNCASYCDTLSGCQTALTPIAISGAWNWMVMYSMWGSGPNVVGSGSEAGLLYYYDYNQGLSENFITIPGENITGSVTTYPNYVADIWGVGENLEPITCYNSNLADPLYNANTGGLVVATNPDDIVCQPAGEINIPGVTMTTDVASLITPCWADYLWNYSYEYYSYPNRYCVYPLLLVETSGNTITSYSFYDNPGSVVHIWNAKCTYPSTLVDTINESEDDQCTAMEQNPNCKLEQEIVDNVYTVQNYVPTGLVPLSSCKDFIGYYDHNICRQWWEKDRTYICPSTSQFDLTAAMQRVKTINDTTQVTGSTVTYTDYYQDAQTNTWVTQGNSFNVGVAQTQSYSTCDNVCKTEIPIQNSQVQQSASSPTTDIPSEYQNNTASYNFYYRKCYPDPTVCPVGPGEQIVINCQCINEFANTFTLLETLKEAGQSAICSSGVKQ